MSNLIVVAGQGLPFLPVLALGLVWLLASGRERKHLFVSALVAAVLATVLLQAAGAFHDDPRPFVVDPASAALFPHSPDNGFPSDHTVYAATAALLVATIRRRLGTAMLLAATIGGLARVAANVHHLQDIAAALVIAVLAVAGGLLLTSSVQRVRLDRARGGKVTASPSQPNSQPDVPG